MSADPVFLRALEDSDLEFLYALENDPAIWGVSDTMAPVSRYALREYLAHSFADFYEVRQLRLVICAQVDGRTVGILDIFDFQPLHLRAGLGITILSTERRRGFALAALAACLEYACLTLRLHQLYCTVATTNQASLHLFEKAGFRRVGIRQEWLRTAVGWEDAIEFQKIF